VHLADYRSTFSSGETDGAGVIVGIIDSGIDGSHESFHDAAGNSRILAVWQQDEGPAGNPNSPAANNPGNAAYSAFNRGREYTGSQVANATDSDTGAGHGTHVAGIAAGRAVTHASGNVSGGMAPAAHIVAVRAIGVPNGNPNRALQYIFQKAADEAATRGEAVPVVINMSFGSHNNAHDGTDTRSRQISTLLKDSSGDYLPGRVLVGAAGNERGDPFHVRHAIGSWGFAALQYRVGVRRTRWDDVTMWVRPTGAGAPDLYVWVKHVPTGWSSSFVTRSSATISEKVSGRNLRVNVEYHTRDIHNGDYEVRVEFTRDTGSSNLPTEDWRIYVLNFSDEVILHAWSAFEVGGFRNQQASDDSHLVISPASSADVISVASMTTRLNYNDIDGNARTQGQTRLGDVSTFSSPGPLRTCSNRLLSFFGLSIDFTHDGLDIAAPGSAIISTQAGNLLLTASNPNNSRHLAVNGKATALSGTSMASPVITGLIACMLAHEPTLTQAQAMQRIRAAGHLPAGSATIFDAGSPDPNDWGQGLVDARDLTP